MDKVLILGGTGAMGEPLSKLLVNKGYNVYVTSRKKRESQYENLRYILGNAKDLTFLSNIVTQNSFDAVVDFMTYRLDEFENVINTVLPRTNQYIMTSSARVFSASDEKITEGSSRLLEVCQDWQFLESNEYAISKAKEEDMLADSGYKNWTVIRPSITYNKTRLQMPIGELEEWMYRVVAGQKLPYPIDLANVKTTLTHGSDVACVIEKLIGNTKALGECINVTSPEWRTWGEIFQIYLRVLEKYGYNVSTFEIQNSLKVGQKIGRYYQIKYARSVDRVFDISKLESIIGHYDFISPEIGLEQCLSEYIEDKPKINNVSWCLQAYFDRCSVELTKLSEFNSKVDKLKYVFARFSPYFSLKRKIVS